MHSKLPGYEHIDCLWGENVSHTWFPHHMQIDMIVLGSHWRYPKGYRGIERI